MNYLKIYKDLTVRGQKDRGLEYSERHHIIPKCMGGTDDESNLVKLTAREHYIAHQLLAMAYPAHHGIVHAAKIMMGNSRYTSREFEWIRVLAVKTSINFHTGRKRSKETCLRISKALKGKRLGIKFSDSHRENISKGRKGIKFSQTHKDNLSARKISQEWKDNLSKSIKGRPLKPETKSKIQEYWKSSESKDKQSELMKKIHSVKILCCYCGKESSRSNHARWHGDNCKEKPNGL